MKPPRTGTAAWAAVATALTGFAACLAGWLAGGGDIDLAWAPTLDLRLQFAFDGLGAQRVESEAFHDNRASNRVSQALGYEPNGVAWATRRGEPAMLVRWQLGRERWLGTRRDDIDIAGLSPCLAMLGL